MGDINVQHVSDIEPLRIAQATGIEKLRIGEIDKIAPVAVHIKELNQIDPLLIESARLDAVRNIDPLQVEQLNVTRLPVVNLSVNQVPGVEIDIGRLPPVSLGVHQVFEMVSDYVAGARILGFEVLRMKIEGKTRIVPQDCARREVAHTHARSFPEVAASGNPAIPSDIRELGIRAAAPRCGLAAGPPRHAYQAPRPTAAAAHPQRQAPVQAPVQAPSQAPPQAPAALRPGVRGG